MDPEQILLLLIHMLVWYCETVRIMFLYAALHGMDIWSDDITNAFIQAPTSEKVFIKCCSAFHEHVDNYAIVVRALYGLRTAAASFRNHLHDCMKTMGFEPCEGDPDLFIRPYVRSDTNKELYEYILIYVDGVLSISDHAEALIRRLNHYFPMKESSIQPPSTYLGSTISQVILPNHVQCWTMGSSKYIKGVMMNVEKALKTRFNLTLPKKAPNPFP